MIHGDYIDYVLAADGLESSARWEADQLPPGLACRSWGAIWGVTDGIGPGEQDVSVRISDANSNYVEKTIPMLVEPTPEAPPGFCIIPGGFFFVGYHPTPQRDGFLNSLAQKGIRIDARLARELWPGAKVHLDTYFIQKFEVTNEEYAQFVQAHGGTPPPQHWGGATPPTCIRNHPVVNISYSDAVDYCQWKSHQARTAGQPHDYGLPTHWEWEKAAKGLISNETTAESLHGPARLYPWNDHWSEAQLNDLNAGSGGTVDVHFHLGSVSSFGVCDLAGNVAEWIDGGKPQHGEIWKQWRGASWRKAGQRYALTFFTGAEMVAPDIRRDDVGFRCVIRIMPERFPAQALVPLGDDQEGFLTAASTRQFIGRFQMARFAVSNMEYASIVSSHRYNETEKWLPITNVTYADAVNFCSLKSRRENRTIRLPTIWEWQRAYRGTHGRVFPWGDNYSRYLCNSVESGWGRPVPVWALWQGATPDGIYNLCGNTFEWLADGSAVGGSWCSTCESFGRAPYPPDESAADRAGQRDIGFRYIAY